MWLSCGWVCSPRCPSECQRCCCWCGCGCGSCLLSWGRQAGGWGMQSRGRGSRDPCLCRGWVCGEEGGMEGMVRIRTCVGEERRVMAWKGRKKRRRPSATRTKRLVNLCPFPSRMHKSKPNVKWRVLQASGNGTRGGEGRIPEQGQGGTGRGPGPTPVPAMARQVALLKRLCLGMVS